MVMQTSRLLIRRLVVGSLGISGNEDAVFLMDMVTIDKFRLRSSILTLVRMVWFYPVCERNGEMRIEALDDLCWVVDIRLRLRLK